MTNNNHSNLSPTPYSVEIILLPLAIWVNIFDYLLGYTVMGMLSFPLECEFGRGVANLFGHLF